MNGNALVNLCAQKSRDYANGSLARELGQFLHFVRQRFKTGDVTVGPDPQTELCEVSPVCPDVENTRWLESSGCESFQRERDLRYIQSTCEVFAHFGSQASHLSLFEVRRHTR